jgi:hypothetical protein
MKHLKLFEDHSKDKFDSIKQDINDIVTDISDNPSYDVNMQLFDYSDSGGWKDYRSTKFPISRPGYNSGLRITISKLNDDVNDNEVKDSLERVLDYLSINKNITIYGYEYKYSNNRNDMYLPYTSPDYPKEWISLRLSIIFWSE